MTKFPYPSVAAEPNRWPAELHFGHPDTKHEVAPGFLIFLGYCHCTCFKQEHTPHSLKREQNAPSSYGTQFRNRERAEFCRFPNCFFAMNRPPYALPTPENAKRTAWKPSFSS